MKTKVILIGTILVTLFTGTSAIASDDIGFDAYEFFNSEITPNDVGYDVYLKLNESKTEITAKKVSLQDSNIDNKYAFEKFNR